MYEPGYHRGRDGPAKIADLSSVGWKLDRVAERTAVMISAPAALNISACGAPRSPTSSRDGST